VSVVTPIIAVAALAAACGIGATVVMPALASSTHRVPSRPVVRPAEGGTPLIAPTAARERVSLAAAGKAVSTCVRYAARAGWPDNGYFGGDLVTAATICVAESRGDPHLIVCDGQDNSITGQGDWPTFKCPEPQTISHDRGLWQLNNVNANTTSDKCAFNPVCNAGRAYLYSGRGISFAPWSSYDQQTYAHYLDLVQAAVTKLSYGTVTSALLGECLAQGKAVVGAKVEIVNCGSGAANQQWVTSGGKLRSGSRCAAIASTRGIPRVVLRRCGRAKTQDWAVFGRYELRNAADHKCLTDPRSSLNAGTQVDVTTCANAKNQTWWLP
jgi:hypothetical protein